VHLCTFHHRLVHEGGFAVEHAPEGQLRFLRPDGKPVPDRPTPVQPRGPTLTERSRAEGIAIDAETIKGLEACDKLDYGMAIDALLNRRRAA
jgi:hypothetical protein